MAFSVGVLSAPFHETIKPKPGLHPREPATCMDALVLWGVGAGRAGGTLSSDSWKGWLLRNFTLRLRLCRG